MSDNERHCTDCNKRGGGIIDGDGKCSTCEGTGKSNYGDDCDVCKGTGTCQTCNGTASTSW